MSYEFEWEDKGYYLHMHGIVTTDDMNNALAEIWANPKSDIMRYCIRDYLDVTKVDIDMTREQIASYVSIYEKNTTNSANNSLNLVAFLSNNEEMNRIIEGYTELMQMYNPDAIFKNFDSVESAREWISISL